jgi:hypothetical protein
MEESGLRQHDDEELRQIRQAGMNRQGGPTLDSPKLGNITEHSGGNVKLLKWRVRRSQLR